MNSPDGTSSSVRCWPAQFPRGLRQRAFAPRPRLQALLRQAERRRHRLRRAGRSHPQRRRPDREHRRPLRRGRRPRRGESQEVRQGRPLQRLPRHAREGRQEHRRVHHRHSRLHARHRRPGLHAARQARLRGKAADPHAVGGAPAPGRRREIQGRHADGQPGLLARRAARGRRNRLVRRHRRCHRSPHLHHARHSPHRPAAVAARRVRPRHARLGSVARRRVDAPLQRVLRALQLARLLSISAPARSATGRPTPPDPSNSPCNSARPPASSASPRSTKAPSRSRIAASSGSISRPAAACPRSRSSTTTPPAPATPMPTTFPEWRTRRFCRRRTTWPTKAAAPAAARPAPVRPPPVVPPALSAVRVGAGGPGVRVFGEPRGPSQPGILTGNGAVFIGTKGIMATVERGEGVWLLPAARWKEYVLPPQLLTRSPGHMLDWVRACKGGDPSCSDFSITAPYARVADPRRHRFPRPR